MRKGVGIFLIALAAVSVATVLSRCARRSESVETVRIGAARSALSGLVYIAHEKGFFKKRGVDAVMKDYDVGPLAIDALRADAVDVVTAAEFVLMQKSFDHPDLTTLGQIADTAVMGIVARKDRGIEKLSDLRGKKIGLPRGSISEFFLGRFLEREKIPFSAVRIVDLALLPAEEALINGSVDAVMMWEPHISRLKERLAGNAVSWPIQGRESFYFLVVSKDDFTRRSPATAEKILRALLDAEDFAAKHPDDAQRIIDERIRFRSGDAGIVLKKSTLRVGLDQGLITLMEAEAQWMIRNNLTEKKEMPNFLNMIDLEPLEAIRPDAVKIIH